MYFLFDQPIGLIEALSRAEKKHVPIDTAKVLCRGLLLFYSFAA